MTSDDPTLRAEVLAGKAIELQAKQETFLIKSIETLHQERILQAYSFAVDTVLLVVAILAWLQVRRLRRINGAAAAWLEKASGASQRSDGSTT
jgi:hypothetical protein